MDHKSISNNQKEEKNMAMPKMFYKRKEELFTSKTLYLSLLIFLLLGMVHVPIVLRCIFIGCNLFSKRIHRILWPCILSAAYFLIFAVPSEAVIIYSFMIVVTLCIIERKRAATESKKSTTYLLIFSMLAMAMLDFLSGFFIYGLKATYVGSDGFPSCFLRILTLFMLVMGIYILSFFVTNLKICGLIIYGTFFLLGSINYWVMEITNSEFLLSDIKLIKTAATVIGEVQIESASIIRFLIFLLLMIGFFILLFKLPLRRGDKKVAKQKACFGVFFIIASVFLLRCGILDYANYYGSVKYGVLTNLIINVKTFEKPSGYRSYLDEIKRVETIDSNEQSSKKNMSPKGTSDVDKDPNIIVIMSEAFSDLSAAGSFNTNKDYMPYTRSILESYPSGNLYASVRGNNTVSSEMEFLTGIPTGLSVKGSDFYQLYLDKKEDSIVSLLEKQNYQTIGIHPFSNAGYNRKNAWDAFGFDETYFIEDFDEAKKVRNFVSDSAFYENIIKHYEGKKDGDPLFIYGISMQNHATYHTGYDGEISLTDSKLKDFLDVNEYLSLLYESDQALKELLTYLESQEEETIVLFYGDHQPLIDVDFYSALKGKNFYDFNINEQADVYKIPYFIWSNYPLDATVPEEMSMNYLANTLLDVAGLEKDAWFSFVDEVYKTYPVITDHFIMLDDKLIKKDTVIETLNKMNRVDKSNPLHPLKQYQVWSYKKVR